MLISAGDQTTKMQNYRRSKNLPNVVSIIISTHTVISEYLFGVVLSNGTLFSKHLVQ